jgi:DNA-binding Lrp family transcriptional regulator
VLRLLAQAASKGLPCPTNAELAKRIGLKDAVAASYRVRRLVQSGAIVVEEPSPSERRVVTIVATGAQTRRAQL